MNIPQSALRPFGITGIPRIYLLPEIIKKQVRAIFYATNNFNIELINDVWDHLKRIGVIPGKVSLNLTPDGDGCLLIARFRFPHKSKYQRVLVTRRLDSR